MNANEKHKWEFKARFRRRAFGWRSQPAIARVKQAVSEIKKVSRTDPLLGAEGAVCFLERIAPALENVDSSSGAIGSALYRAIEELVRIITAAPSDDSTRRKWLRRLWQAIQEDQMPYLESLDDHWGELCASKAIASEWADEMLPTVRSLTADNRPGGYFRGTFVCLSSLYKSERYDELLTLLEAPKLRFSYYQAYAVRTLLTLGRKPEALRLADKCRLESVNGISEIEDVLLEFMQLLKP